MFSVLAARANLGRVVRQHRPAAFAAGDHRLAEHAAHQRPAASSTARASPHARALAYLLERFRARLNGFDHRAFADFIAKAGRLEILDDGLLAAFLLRGIDGKIRPFVNSLQCSTIDRQTNQRMPITRDDVSGGEKSVRRAWPRPAW